MLAFGDLALVAIVTASWQASLASDVDSHLDMTPRTVSCNPVSSLIGLSSCILFEQQLSNEVPSYLESLRGVVVREMR
jgi:hypothetical protein